MTCVSFAPEVDDDSMNSRTSASARRCPARRPTPTPHRQPLSIRHLDLSDCCRVDDSALELIALACPILVRIYIRRCPLVTDVGLRRLARHSCENSVSGLGLRAVGIAECPLIGDRGVEAVAAAARSSLRYVSVARCPSVGDGALSALGVHCPRLRYLNVRGCRSITDRGLAALGAGCRRLEALDVGECHLVSDRGIAALFASAAAAAAPGSSRSGPVLRRLSLRGCAGVSESAVRKVASRCGDRLLHLDVRDCPLVGATAFDDVRRFCRRCIIEHNSIAFY
jgi:hypothetical protein